MMGVWTAEGRQGVRVLEVGCHTGTSTAMMHARARADGGGGYAVGVDVSRSIVERAAALHPEVCHCSPLIISDRLLMASDHL